MLFNMEEMKQPGISNLIKLWLDAGLSQVKLGQMKQTIKVCEWVLVERLFILKPKKNYTIGFRTKKKGVSRNFYNFMNFNVRNFRPARNDSTLW